MGTKRRTAYFGTNGCPRHYFSAISGEFSPQEEEELSKIDEDFQLFGFSGFFSITKGMGAFLSLQVWMIIVPAVRLYFLLRTPV